MKEKIINSNRYRRFKYYVILNSMLLVSVLIIFFGLGFSQYNPTAPYDLTIIYVLAAVLFILVLGIPILYYAVNMIIMRINVKNYDLVNGIVVSVYTRPYFIGDGRRVKVYLEALDRTCLTKVYYGTLYDQVAAGVNVEVAYNGRRNAIIILSVIL